MAAPTGGYVMPRQLEDRIAVVTGAGRGIGRGIALVLARRGARVVASDLNEESAHAVAVEIVDAGGQSFAFACDVTDRDSTDALAAKVLDEFGAIDICVPNAGVIGAQGFEERAEFTDGDWDITFDVNVRGAVNTAEAVAPHMKERQRGKIVIVASQGGRKPQGPRVILGRQLMPYLVSKAAVIQWTHLLAQDLGRHNINVNCVCPGSVWTPMWERIGKNRLVNDPPAEASSTRDVYESAIEMRHPLAVEQTPEDVGYAVAFLASDDASEITGQALNVNAGAVLN